MDNDQGELRQFLDWFQSNNGYLDRAFMGFTYFPSSEGGRGVVAIKDIPDGHVLFTIPRSLVLSPRTSRLPTLLGKNAWKELKLEKGWIGLILCMMWENANGSSSKWFEYLETLPKTFDTPMFWSDDDLAELEGTSVVEKLGRREAEASYNEVLLPAIRSRPDLFSEDKMATSYSLKAYHEMGSRILSRSFNVEEWESEEEKDADANTNDNDKMEVDQASDLENGQSENDDMAGEVDEDEDEDEDEDDSSDVTMVPMADLLNARYGSENAKLFYEEHELKMVATKPIKAGEQIWNTYGDLPNAELLRRYGHVDILPLPRGGLGNPGDIVEIRADLLVTASKQRHCHINDAAVRERIDWWLDEGGDDVFLFEYDLQLPLPFTSLARLLSLNDSEWTKVRDKGKPPKPKVDCEVLSVASAVVNDRLLAYRTTLKDDEELLKASLSLNKRHAVIVRLGEKMILNDFKVKIRSLLAGEGAKTNDGSGRNGKRSRGQERSGSSKKSRR